MNVTKHDDINDCIACSQKTFAPVEGGTQCFPCAKGGAGVTALFECAGVCSPGQRKLDANDTCVSCAAGQFTSLVNEESCRDCPAGFYSRDVGQAYNFCKACEKGKHGNNMPRAANSSVCVECVAGKFSAVAFFQFFPQMFRVSTILLSLWRGMGL
jgi:hypothetical protein